MPCREGGARCPQDNHPDRVVSFGEFEGGAQLDEHSARLRVALFRTVEGDRRDTAVVDRFVPDVIEILHATPPIGPAIDRTDPGDVHERS